MRTPNSYVRSNYVRFRADCMLLVEAYCELFRIMLRFDDVGRYALLPLNGADGARFAEFATVKADSLLADHLNDLAFDDDGVCEVDLDLRVLARWMTPGQVLVATGVRIQGRSVTECAATAFNHRGESVSIALEDIYQQAAEAFGVEARGISLALN